MPRNPDSSEAAQGKGRPQFKSIWLKDLEPLLSHEFVYEDRPYERLYFLSIARNFRPGGFERVATDIYPLFVAWTGVPVPATTRFDPGARRWKSLNSDRSKAAHALKFALAEWQNRIRLWETTEYPWIKAILLYSLGQYHLHQLKGATDNLVLTFVPERRPPPPDDFAFVASWDPFAESKEDMTKRLREDFDVQLDAYRQRIVKRLEDQGYPRRKRRRRRRKLYLEERYAVLAGYQTTDKTLGELAG